MRLVKRFRAYLFRKFYPFAVSSTIDRCAEICDRNAVEADTMYDLLHDISTSPDTDFGVLKYACYSGQAGRDANDIRRLKDA